MCNHCRSVRGNRANIQDQKPVRGSRETRVDESSCCQWRRTCCGGGCCDDVNCCGTETSTQNTGYQNTGYNYDSAKPSTKFGTGMNYEIGRTERQSECNVAPRRGHIPGSGTIRDEDTVPCVFQKEKYCVGGDCYLEEDEDRDELGKRRKTGQTLR